MNWPKIICFTWLECFCTGLNSNVIMKDSYFFVSDLCRTVNTTTLLSGSWRMIPLSLTWGFALMRTTLDRFAGLKSCHFVFCSDRSIFAFIFICLLFIYLPLDIPGGPETQRLRLGGNQWEQEGIHRVNIYLWFYSSALQRLFQHVQSTCSS